MLNHLILLHTITQLSQITIYFKISKTYQQLNRKSATIPSNLIFSEMNTDAKAKTGGTDSGTWIFLKDAFRKTSRERPNRRAFQNMQRNTIVKSL